MQKHFPRLPRSWIVACFFVAGLWPFTPARAQNDWQYPDPYFGILEIEKSHDRSASRRYRDTVDPVPRSAKSSALQAEQADPGAPKAAAAPPPASVPQRPRWRNRWRR